MASFGHLEVTNFGHAFKEWQRGGRGAVDVLEKAQGWVWAVLLVGGAAIIAITPVYEKVRAWVQAAAQPAVDAHNVSPDAHAKTHEAIALLQQSVDEIRRMISTESEHRKQQLLAVQSQLQNAIDLLPKE